MYELGGLEEKKEETKNETSVEKTEEKRKPFHYWTVGGRDYRLKLKASTIGKLENKYKRNIMNMIDDMPPLSVMLTIIQAAMSRGSMEWITVMFRSFMTDGQKKAEIRWNCFPE